jgi:isoleucyl-tRNA synthetase
LKEQAQAQAKNSNSQLSFKKDKDLHRPYIDEIVLRCDECGGEMRRVEDVIDCWYDSGAASFAQWHYPFAKGDFKENFPASFVTEAIDQTRGWFYSLLGVSTAVFNEAPYLNVLSVGFILDEKGVKMSKSKGNVVDLESIFDKEGADALRWYFFTAGPPSEDIKFSEKAIIEKQKRFLSTLWNSYFFFITYANIDNFNPGAKGEGKGIPVEKRSLMDRWIISRLNSLIKEVIEHLEEYELHLSSRRIEDFVINDLSNWYIRRSRRRFWVAEESFDKDCAYLTLYEVLLSLCKLLAPFVPFVTEYIYRNIAREELESVHFCDYPQPNGLLIDAELEDSMHLISELVEAGRRIRSDAGIKIRQPLSEVVVVVRSENEEKREKIESLAWILKDELNVKEIRFADVAHKDKFAAATTRYKRAEIDDLSLFLNVSLEKSLLEEGLVRDLIRRIQGMRKDLDLEYTAKIRIMYEGNEEVKEAVKNLSDYICEETLAIGIEEKTPSSRSRLNKGKRFYEKKWNIDKKEVYLTIEYVPPIPPSVAHAHVKK